MKTWIILSIIVGIVCLLFLSGEDADVVVLIIGSRSDVSKNRMSNMKVKILDDCENKRVFCYVVDFENEVLDGRRGMWSVLMFFFNTPNVARWYLIVEETSEVRMSNFKNFVQSENHEFGSFYGFALQDEQPSRIHKFGVSLPSDFKYPLFSAGALISKKVVSGLKDYWKTENHTVITVVDAKYEFSKYLLSKLNVEMKHEPGVFCKEESPNCLVVAKKDVDGETSNILEDNDIYVMIKTCHMFHKSRLPIMQSTWAKNLPRLDFCSDVEDPEIPTIDMKVGNEGFRQCAKTWEIFKRFLEFGYDAKWLLVTDDDTLISWTRLKKMLAQYDEKQKIIIGERYGFEFSWNGTAGFDFPSGGSGMIFTRNAVKTILKVCPESDRGKEDNRLIALCALEAGIPITHNHRFHYGTPYDYSKDFLDDPISFQGFQGVNPIEVYEDWLKDPEPINLESNNEL